MGTGNVAGSTEPMPYPSALLLPSPYLLPAAVPAAPPTIELPSSATVTNPFTTSVVVTPNNTTAVLSYG